MLDSQLTPNASVNYYLENLEILSLSIFPSSRTCRRTRHSVFEVRGLQWWPAKIAQVADLNVLGYPGYVRRRRATDGC